MIEILAPAGSFESMQAAVRSGADAVYFGASSFNARRNAKNFSSSDISTAVSYCHTRGVHAYLTLNTLISDAEINDALTLVKTTCDAGIDGVIIQDMGLASLIKKAAPTLPLHASTQMSVHTPEAVKLLHSFGFKRVVLARENSKDEIKEIAKVANKLGIELEVFVQGALCMSVSGQCLLSAVLGSRSGNRGLCAGPCRMPFKVKNGNGYDLSLKDLCLYPYLKELEEMGIASLKIEGRMKRPEYVAMATDAAYTALYSPENTDNKIDTLKNVFSRSGFTQGYYNNQVDSSMFGTRSDDDITATKQVINSIHELYRRERQTIALSFDVKIKKDTAVSLTVSDGENAVTVMGDIPETAQTRSVDADFVKDKLCKCGGTPYYTDKFIADVDDGLSIPASALSKLRNDALDKLTQLRSSVKPIEFVPVSRPLPEKQMNKSYKIVVSLHSISQLPRSLDKIDMLILPLSTDVDKVKGLVEKGIKIAVKTPPAMFSREKQVADRLSAFKAVGVEFAVAENIGAVNLIKQADMKIVGGMRLNCFNSYSTLALPLDMAVLSPELDENQLSDLRSNIPCGIFAYGKLPLMLLRNCPIRSNVGCADCTGKITDRMNTQFPIMCEDGATVLYNDRVVYLADRLHLLNKLDFALLSFTSETADEVESIINQYKNGGKSGDKFTRGLYFKGVK